MRYFIFSIHFKGHLRGEKMDMGLISSDTIAGFGTLIIESKHFPRLKFLEKEQKAIMENEHHLKYESMIVMGWSEFDNEEDYRIFMGDKNIKYVQEEE